MYFSCIIHELTSTRDGITMRYGTEYYKMFHLIELGHELIKQTVIHT